jgi:hypothetical protein
MFSWALSALSSVIAKQGSVEKSSCYPLLVVMKSLVAVSWGSVEKYGCMVALNRLNRAFVVVV